MTDTNDELRNEYRAIRAPAYLATRTVAEAGAGLRGRRSWRPALAMLTVAALLLVAMPLLVPDAPRAPANEAVMSLAQLGRMTPDKPPMSSPSLSNIRTVSAPPLPAKPTTAAPQDPQSATDPATRILEEIFHAYI